MICLSKKENTKEVILIKYLDEYFTERDSLKGSAYDKFKEIAENESDY